MLLNIPYTKDIQVFQKELKNTLEEYLNMDFNPFLEIVHDYDRIRIHIDNIVYAERCQRATEIHMLDGKIYRCYIPIYKLEKLLPPSMFCRISHSAIVNWRFMSHTRAYQATIRWKNNKVELGMWPKNYKWVKEETFRRNNQAV